LKRSSTVPALLGGSQNATTVLPPALCLSSRSALMPAVSQTAPRSYIGTFATTTGPSSSARSMQAGVMPWRLRFGPLLVAASSPTLAGTERTNWPQRSTVAASASRSGVMAAAGTALLVPPWSITCAFLGLVMPKYTQ